MERTNFSILFFVRKTNVKKNGKLPVYVRLTVNGERAEFVLERDVLVTDWEPRTGKVKGNTKQARETNDYLDHVKMRIRENRIILDERKEEVTAKVLKDAYFGVKKEEKTLLYIIDNHNNDCISLLNKDYQINTIKKYLTLKNHIQKFLKEIFRKDDIALNALNGEVIRKFETYLKLNRNMQHNSAMKYVKCLKKIIGIALNNGWLETNPFAGIKYHHEDVSIDFLTQDELNKLARKSFSVERINQVKDAYLFCCFTGLAFIDLVNLKSSDIESKDGKFWIKKERQKTNNLFIVPLLKPAIDIMEKYKNYPESIKKGRLLPVLTNQKMNAYLKEIADLSGINKRLTTHTARHTFATTVTLANQVSMEVVAKMLGHSSTKMTAKYARVLDDVINKDMEKVYAMFE